MRKLLPLGLLAVVVLVASASCLDPTEITVDVSTDLRCADTKGTSFVGGKPGAVENAPPTTTTMDCDNGHVGTLVSTPSGDKDVDAAFLVVTGVDKPVSDCNAADHFQGCIVQRRLIHYLKHTPLTLPITMWLVCKNVECTADTTCARNGLCVPARIPDANTCEGSGCVLPGDPPFTPGEDGGNLAADGSGGNDGPTSDGSASDALVDAGADAPDSDAEAGSVLVCPGVPDCTGTPCCFPITNGPTGRCSASCNTVSEITMECTHAKTDCPAGRVCCATISGGPVQQPLLRAPPKNGMVSLGDTTTTSCIPQASCASNVFVCTGNEDCPAPMTCTLASTSHIYGETDMQFGQCN